MKKFLVLGILFALPITAYLFFASGKNNFARLPVLTEKVDDISKFDTNSNTDISFQDHISVVAFFGSDLENIKGNTFNLDKKILRNITVLMIFNLFCYCPRRPGIKRMSLWRALKISLNLPNGK